MFAFMLVDFLYSRILKLRYYKNIKELLCQNYIHSFIHVIKKKKLHSFSWNVTQTCCQQVGRIVNDFLRSILNILTRNISDKCFYTFSFNINIIGVLTIIYIVVKCFPLLSLTNIVYHITYPTNSDQTLRIYTKQK